MFVVFYSVNLNILCICDLLHIVLSLWHTYGSMECVCVYIYIYMHGQDISCLDGKETSITVFTKTPTMNPTKQIKSASFSYNFRKGQFKILQSRLGLTLKSVLFRWIFCM